MAKTVTIGEVISKFKTKHHFVTAYEKKGKILPTSIDFGWNYIKQVLTGEKLLININQLENYELPPRFIE